MSLAEQITDDLKDSMRARDSVRTSTLRLVLAGIKNLRVQEGRGGADVTDEEVTALLAKEAKSRRESIETYSHHGREDLAAKEQAELEVIEAYLPEQLSEDQIAGIVDEVIADVGAEGPADLGKVMGPVMARVKGQADGKLVNAVVRERLGA